MGAVDEATEKSIRKEYEKMVDYLKLRMPFKEVNIGLYCDYGVEGKIRKNKEVDDMVIHNTPQPREGRYPIFLGKLAVTITLS